MNETRSRIIDAALTLFTARGYQRTSIDQVIDLASLSGKSHFYHYFRSKDELGLEVLDRQFDRFAERGLGILREESCEPIERLKRFIDAMLMLQEAHGVDAASPFGNLASEMAELREVFRARLALVFERWASQIQQLLWEARYSLRPGTDTGRLSCFIIATLEGALMLSKVNRDANMLREIGTDLKRFVSMHVREGVAA